MRTRGRPFAPGNPGRPRGARHKVTVAAESLLDGEAEGLCRKAVELALGGDVTALRLCLERVVPVRRDCLVALDLPKLVDGTHAVESARTVISHMAAGEITPAEANAVLATLETFARLHQTAELEERIARLEARL